MFNDVFITSSKNGQVFVHIWSIHFQIQPWMAMLMGVFLIILCFRIYEYISNGEWKAKARKRKDSIVDPLLLIKQMINTKPKRFTDIFPEELKELAKRRVNVLKEKDPFGISSLFPYNFMMNPSSSSSSSNLTIKTSTATSITPPLSLKKKRNQVMFHTPQPLSAKLLHTEKDPSPLSLSPSLSIDNNNIESENDINNNNNNNNNNNIAKKDNPLLMPISMTPSPSSLSSDKLINNNDQPTIEEIQADQEKEDSGEIPYINNNEQPQITIDNNNINNNNLKNINNQFNNFKRNIFNDSIGIEDNQNNLNNTSTNSTGFKKAPKVMPSVKFNLVGLALSGGGIRSATFNLGLLQALSKHKLFKRVDYLSTVSGGGFIGSCLISLLSEGTYTTDWHSFPFHYGRGHKEGTPLTHLRNSANYLANGIFEFLLFPVLALRGIVLNLVSIFPFVWGLLLFERHVPIQFGDGYHITLRIAWNLLIHIIIFPVISRPKVTVPLLLSFVFLYSSELSRYFSQVSNLDLSISMALHLYLNFPMIFKKEGSKVWYDRSFGWLFIVLIASAFTESLPLIENVYLSYFGGASDFRVYPLVSLIALILADSLAFTLLTNPKLSPWKRLVFHITVSIIGPLLLMLTYLELSVWITPNSSLIGVGNGLCFLASLLSFFTLDINETSMHKYYRDRLSKAYMFSIRNGRFRPYGGEKISRLNKRSVAPYLLVNTTLNSVTNYDGLDIPNARGSDFFIFSQHYSGSESSGYRSTEQMERLDRRLDLATAVSISGAAVGTKMGTATIPTLVMSMGILNIRLGYWLPNPLGIFLSHPFMGRLFYGGFACYHLVKEFGWTPMTSKDWCINLSDGGHIENLGAYELIKRRCKYIIISDSEADPDMTFPSMAQLMRLVRIDFGINIQINLDDIRRENGVGYSKKHWTVGKIIYSKKKSSNQFDSEYDVGGGINENPPSGEVGYILYIKSSLTGDEDEIIKEYQSQHPSFPHESTTDQFFTEAQFEAYRSLGYHIGGSSLFGKKHNRNYDGEDIEGFFERIYHQCTGDLPLGWKEKRDETGSKYFVQEDMKKKTWFDPRFNNNKKT